MQAPTTPAHTVKPSFRGVIVTAHNEGEATIGQPYPVMLRFNHPSQVPAWVSFKAEEGLKLGHAQARQVPYGTSYMTVMVTPSSPGRSYLNVYVRQGGGGHALSVPIQVGSTGPRMEPSGQLKPGLGGSQFQMMQLP